MGPLTTILSEQIVQQIGWVLVHFLWQGVAVAAFGWCGLKVLNKASSNTRYIAACFGLGLMVLAPVITFTMTGGPIADASTATLIPAPAASVGQTVAEPQNIAVFYAAQAVPEESFVDLFTARLEAALPYCVMGWFVGVGALSLWYLGGWCQLQKLRRIGTKTVSQTILAQTSELAARLGIERAVRIVESALVQVPSAIGWLSPMVLLPASALTGLTEMQLKAMIAHELAHIKRCDYLVNIIQTSVEILGFYHPAIWWMSRQIRIERENCCDDVTVNLLQNKKDYAGALFSMAQIRHRQYELAVAANGGQLSSRISRLAGKSVQTQKSGWIPSSIILTLVLAIVIPTAFALTSHSTEDSEKGSARQLQMQESVEDFFNHNYRDITARKTLEWGEVTEDSAGHYSIRYKYEAVIWGKDKIVSDELFTFDEHGKCISVKKLNRNKNDQDDVNSHVHVYQVNRTVSGFPDNDFSTPESAAAHMNRLLANGEMLREISEPSLKKKMSPDRPRIDVSEKGAEGWRNAQVEEVRVYENRYAAVLMRIERLLGDIIDVRYLKRVDGQWLNMGNDVFSSVEKARKKFKTIYELKENEQREIADLAKYAKPVQSYQLNRAVSDFSETEDFSTPESAYAAINRVMAADDSAGWQRVSVKRLAGRLSNEKQVRKKKVDPEWSNVVLNARILEVRIQGDEAVVIAEFPQALTSKPIKKPLDSRHLVREDGRWLNTGENRFESIEQARDKFDTMLKRQAKEQESHSTVLDKPDMFIGQAEMLFDKLRNADYEKVLSYYNDETGKWRWDGWKKLELDYRVHTNWPSFALWVCRTFKDNPIQSVELGEVLISDKQLMGEKNNAPAIPYKLVLQDGGMLKGELYFSYRSRTDNWQPTEGIDWHLQTDPIKESSDDKVELIQSIEKMDVFAAQRLEKTISVDIEKSPQGEKLSVQYAVMAVCKAAQIPYQWDKTTEQANGKQRMYINPVRAKEKQAKSILMEILAPVGLTYDLDQRGLYLKQAESIEIEIENSVHDFGQVAPSVSGKCEFKFTNIGPKTLTIDRVRSTCGCTVPELTQKEYAPGESGVVRVEFKAPKTKGEIAKNLYLVSNAPGNPQAKLTIKADVVVSVEASPEHAELRLDRENAAMSEITLKSVDGKAFSIKSISVTHSVMTIPFDPAQQADQFTLVPAVDIEKLAEFPIGVIQIETDLPEGGTQTVRYNTMPYYEVSRSRMILQNAAPLQKLIEKMLLRAHYGKTVEIQSAVSKNGYMEIAAQQPDGNHMWLEIAIVPPNQEKRYFTDELTIVLTDGHEVAIRCSGWFEKPDTDESVVVASIPAGGGGGGAMSLSENRDLLLSEKSEDVKPKAENRIDGTVIDSKGNPVAKALVLPMPHGGRPILTDTDGKFSLPGPSQDPDVDRIIELLIVRNPETNEAAVSYLESSSNPMRIQLQKAMTLSGRVTDAEGRPIAGANVEPSVHYDSGWHAAFGYTQFDPTDSSGYFEIPALPHELEYGLCAKAKGCILYQERLGQFAGPGRIELNTIILQEKDQISVEARFLLLPKELTEEIGLNPELNGVFEMEDEHKGMLFLDDLQSKFIVKATQAHESAKTLTFPKAVVYDNETANLSVMQTKRFMNQQGEPENIDTGIRLEITPHLLSEGHILTEIESKYTDLLDEDKGVSITASIVTKVTVPDGGTVLMGPSEIKKEGKPTQYLYCLVKVQKTEKQQVKPASIPAGGGGGFGGGGFGGGGGGFMSPTDTNP